VVISFKHTDSLVFITSYLIAHYATLISHLQHFGGAMGVEFHITRAKFWADNDDAQITTDE
jgi:hypothetical protein